MSDCPAFETRFCLLGSRDHQDHCFPFSTQIVARYMPSPRGTTSQPPSLSLSFSLSCTPFFLHPIRSSTVIPSHPRQDTEWTLRRPPSGRPLSRHCPCKRNTIHPSPLVFFCLTEQTLSINHYYYFSVAHPIYNSH